jgi:2,3-bisphosphoglycerate-dependent phosphoglycerate mutase
VDLILVRHAEPERIEGGGGVPANPRLTARGKEQAQRLADWLAHEQIDVVLSSPQQRAIDTAEPVAHAHGLPISVVEGLVEYDVQSDSYIPVEEMMASKDPRMQAMIQGDWEELGGESTETFRTRVAVALDEIIAGYPGQRVVAVCHGGVINVALAGVLGMDQHLWFHPHYTSVSRIAASRAGVRSIRSINENAHLEATRDRSTS